MGQCRSTSVKDQPISPGGDDHVLVHEFGSQGANAVLNKKKSSQAHKTSPNLQVDVSSGDEGSSPPRSSRSLESQDSFNASFSARIEQRRAQQDLREAEELSRSRSRSRGSSVSSVEDLPELSEATADDVQRPPPPAIKKKNALSRLGNIFLGSSLHTRRTSPTEHPGIVGLANLGNTCFLNSGLQCLSHTAPLVDFFLQTDWRRRINYKNPIGFQGKIAQAFGALVSEMWTHETRSPVTKSLAVLKRELGKARPQFSGYEQHDSQELIVFLLDGLHEDLNQVESKPYVEDIEYDGKAGDVDEGAFAHKAWEGHLRRNQSIIVDMSQGQLKSTLVCSRCSHTSIKYEPFMYLSLPVPTGARRPLGAAITLQMCLEEFCKKEHLSGWSQWYCPKCKEHVDASKQLTIWSLPDILIVHLKRFQQEGLYGRGKINALVEFPTRNLDLSDALAPSSSREQGRGVLYDLYAVSNHHGGLNGGHYTASGRNKANRQWYRFDDSSFTEMREEDACSAAAYVLFYQKSNATSNPAFTSQSTTSSPMPPPTPTLPVHHTPDDADPPPPSAVDSFFAPVRDFWNYSFGSASSVHSNGNVKRRPRPVTPTEGGGNSNAVNTGSTKSMSTASTVG